ncbi:MAG: dihydrofolate reductase [Pyrinomonadaceae bacterium]
MAFVGIVAVDRNRAIGMGGSLPWHYSSDMKFFRAQTSGQICVMGHNTWRSLKKPLPNRLNVVLSRTGITEPHPSVLVVPDSNAVLALAPYVRDDIFIMGGARTYAAFANEITRWIVTEVPLTVEGADTFMPADFLDGFQKVESLSLEEGLVVKFYKRDS